MTYSFQSRYSDHKKIHIRQPSLQHKLKESILYIVPTGAFAQRWTQIGVKKKKKKQYTVSALLLPAVWSSLTRVLSALWALSTTEGKKKYVKNE